MLFRSQGIEGESHFGGDSADQVTLIASESIEAFNEATDCAYGAVHFRRNLVTTGIDIDQMIGKRIQIGEALLEGVEACDPCAGLGARLANYRLTQNEAVRALVDRGGLRARVVTSGRVAQGDDITVTEG